ncbi:TPA: hypothetical protein ACPVZ4_002891 [Vibrio parahaemolyticus]
MTAEVAVYNKSAVALAADSASTISGGRMHKIYNNAEKLFALTKFHPVGIMVFGAGDFINTPWELIIKAYRKDLGEKSCPTLKDYVQDFIAYVPRFIEKLPWSLDRYLTETMMGYYEYVESKIEAGSSFEEDAVSLISVFSDEADELTNDKSVYLESFSSKDVAPTQKLLRPIIDKLLTLIGFDELPRAQKSKLRKSFLKFATYALLKEHDFDSATSGLVFAGYGEDQYLPEIYTFDIKGMHLGRLRSVLVKDKCAEQGEAGIVPFAQQSEVESFMQGVTDHHVSHFFHLASQHITREALIKFIEILDEIDDIDDKTREIATDKMFASLVKNQNALKKEVLDDIRENHVDKIVSMIEHLPKNELSYMAESLVNLTAFKRKVSYETDTVGGPIDVAVISKGDGFVWIKRKHYYPSELNQEHHLQHKYGE